MRIHALLSWFDEPPAALAALITSLKLGAVDHLIAIDGAYQLYPSQHAVSPPDQAAVIHQTAAGLGIATTIHTPTHKWAGNEVEKRTQLFNLAHALSDDGDWWWVIDADEVITAAPHDLKAQLEATDLHVAQATITEPRDLNNPQAQHFNWPRAGQYPLRMLFKAQPIHCRTNHYTYVTQDDRILWASDSSVQEPALHIDGLHVEHREHQRAQDRREDKDNYYRKRAALGIERSTCIWDGCDQQATREVGRNFHLVDTNGVEPGFAAELVEACEKHARRIEHDNYWYFRKLGVEDPDAVLSRTQLRPGAAHA